jgi:hypothetical protein
VALRGGGGAVIRTDAKDLTDALLLLLSMTRGRRATLPLRVIAVVLSVAFFFMRGNGSKNASRLKSYGRFLSRFFVWGTLLRPKKRIETTEIQRHREDG